MKKNTNYNLSGIAPEFVWSNLTYYQQETIQLKYKVTNLVDSRPVGVSKEEMFVKVSEQINLSWDRIRDIYYTTKK